MKRIVCKEMDPPEYSHWSLMKEQRQQYLFTAAVVTNYHKFSGLHETDLLYCTSGIQIADVGLSGLKSSFLQGWVPFKGVLGLTPFPCLFQLLKVLHFLAHRLIPPSKPRIVNQSFSSLGINLTLLPWSYFLLWLSCLPLLLLKTLVITLDLPG